MNAPQRAVVVLISADAEWRVVRDVLPDAAPRPSPVGDWIEHVIDSDGRSEPLVFLHGGWGKIAAAASTQYAIDRWSPALLVNLGTCGGFAGLAVRGDVILATRTLVYDIIERMGDPAEALAWYATELDLDWLAGEYPSAVRPGPLVSADADLDPLHIERLSAEHGAVAGDWESGAIAWVAARNAVPCLILRGVTDVVGAEGGEAYGDAMALFTARTDEIMRDLLAALPAWLARRPGG
jgi:adenosylhomocysteine nucleosidase